MVRILVGLLLIGLPQYLYASDTTGVIEIFAIMIIVSLIIGIMSSAALYAKYKKPWIWFTSVPFTFVAFVVIAIILSLSGF